MSEEPITQWREQTDGVFVIKLRSLTVTHAHTILATPWQHSVVAQPMNVFPTVHLETSKALSQLIRLLLSSKHNE